MAKHYLRFHITLLTFLIIRCCKGSNVGNSLNDDLLLPYPLSQGHGPQHNNRYVRDCQPVIHGNVTYETWTSDKTADFPVATTKVFVSKFPVADGTVKSVYGHMTVVRNPLKTVSVLEPGGPEGCTKNLTATVEETAKPRKCLVAQNGGFFNTLLKQCLGNIVSDGNLVQNSKGIQNAQFGIKKDGTLVFGYLSEDDVLDERNPFVQLVSGVVWLLRNGNIYINESKAAECKKTQETGTFDKFVDVVSARTAVGHDREGRLILIHVDGQTGDRGINLWEMATFLKSLGVVNAINLDGGGSATLVLNGSLASYPSDHCTDDPMWRCPRNISTVLCVHEPQCDPANCSGHGQCLLGECQCTSNWKGPACNLLECEPAGCGSHGMCTANGCVCDAGWMDPNCSEVCHRGFYGDGCNKTCSCENGGTCDHVHGSCTCPPGFHGHFCEQECPFDFYGQDCKQQCQCESTCPCNPVTGSCNITYQGETNRTLHRAVHCLATHIFESWKHNVISQEQTYFSQTTWIIITAILGLLLLTSTIGNMIWIYGKCRHDNDTSHSRSNYSYHPLNEVSEKLNCAEIPEPTSMEWTNGSIQESVDFY
ncbi:N-acetylglucosamine-1-phosphodiester alpha-N-acetylglucosaminidase [Polyodon spathula]|uniref:N-acetylglucosamine-1-phosphodiester alpha-N-acetylglucosaminidase n=1 Tax=Polyodon spathula TaxID=7913 RepID=UPI001B7DFA63|nr:N-acetylglucosamine-1-phosphodiester alpha-N-acetylglucosaminidase [Polyodon spathula]